MPKVKFGLKNVHYAILTEGTSPSWGTPVKVAGAVSLSLSQEGGRNTFYADNTSYYVAYTDNGYSGDLEMAMIPDSMLADVWGMAKDANGVVVESNSAEPKPFALLFQIENDEADTKYVMYRCFGDRPAINSATIEDTKTPQTASISLSAVPVINGSLDGRVMAKTTDTTSTSIASAWFSTVYTG